MASDAPRTKSDLQHLDHRRFEELVAELWRQDGWSAEVMPPGPDNGIDVIATRAEPFDQKQVIQAKRYGDQNPISGPDIQQYASLKQQVKGTDVVVVVTTGRFTDSAVARARELNVKLVDGDDLETMVRNASLPDDIEPEIPARDQSSKKDETVPLEEQPTAPESSSLLLGLLLLPIHFLLLFSVDEWIEIVRALIIVLVGGYVAWAIFDTLVLSVAVSP